MKLYEKVSIWATAMTTLVGGVYWLTNVYAQGQATANEVTEMRLEQQDYHRTLEHIDSRLSRIEGKLDAAE